jgi:hypothetical protein
MRSRVKAFLFLGAIFLTGIFVGITGTLLVERRLIDNAFRQMKAPLADRAERMTQLLKRRINLDADQSEKARVIVLDILKRLEPKRNEFFLGVQASYDELVERLTPELRGDQKLTLPGIAYLAESMAAAAEGSSIESERDFTNFAP